VVATHHAHELLVEPRVVVRDATKADRLKKLGAEVFVADLDDQDAMARAARGIFLLSPDIKSADFIGERRRMTQKLVETMAAEKVRHVVLLSSTGAQQPSGTGPIVTVYNAEQQLRASGLAATFVRPGFFLENWGNVLHPVRSDGVLPSFIPADKRVASVSTVDIGKAVAQALLDGPRGVRVIELSGPSDVSPNDVAAAFSQILGKKVSVVELPLDAVVPTLTSFGVSQGFAELMRELYDGLARGRVVAKPGEHFRGTTPLETTLRALLGRA
jgi:uncharacterized protein YbjT (DUF2867 family)